MNNGLRMEMDSHRKCEDLRWFTGNRFYVGDDGRNAVDGSPDRQERKTSGASPLSGGHATRRMSANVCVFILRSQHQ